MSTPVTGYTVNGVDIGTMFYAKVTGSTAAANTGMLVNNATYTNTDLSTIFECSANATTVVSASQTNYIVNNGNYTNKDLYQIFAGINSTFAPVINAAGGTAPTAQTYNGYTYYLFTDTTRTMTFRCGKPYNIVLVGGGGAGGKIYSNLAYGGTYYPAGAGGGGGAIRTATISDSSEYSITVGNGGIFMGASGGTTTFISSSLTSYRAVGAPNGTDGANSPYDLNTIPRTTGGLGGQAPAVSSGNYYSGPNGGEGGSPRFGTVNGIYTQPYRSGTEGTKFTTVVNGTTVDGVPELNTLFGQTIYLCGGGGGGAVYYVTYPGNFQSLQNGAIGGGTHGACTNGSIGFDPPTNRAPLGIYPITNTATSYAGYGGGGGGGTRNVNGSNGQQGCVIIYYRT